MPNNHPIFLYIEDHPASRRIMEVMLNDVSGYENLIIFEDTLDLVPRLEALDVAFDVVFLDLNLAPLDGFSVRDQLHNHHLFRNARFVAITAAPTLDDLQSLQDAGFDGAIGKPLGPDTFPDQVERILQGQPVWEAN